MATVSADTNKLQPQSAIMMCGNVGLVATLNNNKNQQSTTTPRTATSTKQMTKVYAAMTMTTMAPVPKSKILSVHKDMIHQTKEMVQSTCMCTWLGHAIVNNN